MFYGHDMVTAKYILRGLVSGTSIPGTVHIFVLSQLKNGTVRGLHICKDPKDVFAGPHPILIILVTDTLTPW